MAANWRLEQTAGGPALVRTCREIVALAVRNAPTHDLLSSLYPLDDCFCLCQYSESPSGAILAETLELLAGSTDLRFWRVRREVKERTRSATVRGDLLVANGRREPLLFGGPGRLQHDFRRFREMGMDPPQLTRLREMEAAGVDIVEIPSSPSVDNRFAGLTFAQPAVISIERIREAEASGRVKVSWQP